MNTLESYPAYKDSGVEWLDSIPLGWEMRKLGSLFQLQRRSVSPRDKTVTAFRDGQVTLRKNRRTEGFTEANKEIGYQGVASGDLVIHNMDAFAGAIGVSDSTGKSTPVYSITTPRQDENAHYFAHVLRHLARTGYITALARGIRERSTDFRWGSAKEVLLPVPPAPEQQRIVAYLDRETAGIDAFIADQEELIGLLTERRAASISHAVTKGLDPSAPMNDSGVEWLGEVPRHWKVTRVSRFFEVVLGKMLDAAKIAPVGSRVLPYLRAGNIQEGGLDLRSVNEMPYSSSEERALDLRKGDLVVVEGGAIGVNVYLDVDMPGWSFQKTVNRVRPTPRSDASSRFLGYALDTLRWAGVIDMVANKSTIAHLTAEKLERIQLAFPPAHEQRRIADVVREETAEIDAAIADARKAIALSRERRAALISAAVTGKIDVRGAA